MSTRQLAAASGVSPTTINRIEKHNDIPYGDTLRKLAEALNITGEELLVEDEKEDERRLQKVG